MLLTISTTAPDHDSGGTYTPTDLGYLLHKHPDRLQRFELSFGAAHVFYPVANETRCTAALMLEVDPVALARGGEQHRPGHQLWPYVNDRPYVASSFMSVAISRVLGTALSGNCKTRPELVDTPIPLELELAVLPSRGRDGAQFLEDLFTPLGYTVDAIACPLDEDFEQWGTSPFYKVTLRSDSHTLSQALSHLYVLIPVLDDDKHYFIGQDEVEKLLRHGEGWLDAHPMREAITRRYLERRGRLVRAALARLSEEEDEAGANTRDSKPTTQEDEDAPIKRTLHQERLATVHQWLVESGARSVLDLGCGEGKLMQLMQPTTQFEKIAGVDVSTRALERAERKLRLTQLSPAARERIALWQGSLTYRDKRIEGFDAAALVEVIEHLDEERLGALERAVFQFARPSTVIVTTPNSDYNALFESLPAGEFRHSDHRFEWSREEFEAWCDGVASAHGYTARFLPIGPVDDTHGAPCQAAIFTLNHETTTATTTVTEGGAR